MNETAMLYQMLKMLKIWRILNFQNIGTVVIIASMCLIYIKPAASTLCHILPLPLYI